MVEAREAAADSEAGDRRFRVSLAVATFFCAVGLTYGYLDAMLPAPADETQFWVGNLTLPWLLLPFAAGWSQRSWWWAITTATTALVLTVIAFYADLLALNFTDGDASNDLPGVMAIAPWLVAAVVAGPIFAVLGRWRGRSRALLPGLVMAAVPIAEPWMWTLRLGFLPKPPYLWAIETGAGLVLVGLVVWAHRSRRSAAGADHPLQSGDRALNSARLG